MKKNITKTIFLATAMFLVFFSSWDIAQAKTKVVKTYLYATDKVSNFVAVPKKAKITSSNPKVVQIANKQLISVGLGKSTITVRKGKKKEKIIVKVNNTDKWSCFNSISVSLYKGQTYTITNYNTQKILKFSSQNSQVATVDQKGKITAKEVGATSVTVKTKGNTYSIAVTVLPEKAKKESIVFPDKKDSTYYKKGVVKNKKKYILMIHQNTCVPNDFESKFDKLVTLMEKKVGYSINPKKDIWESDKKVVVFVGGPRDTMNMPGALQIREADLNLRNDAAVRVGRYLTNAILGRHVRNLGPFGSFYGLAIAEEALTKTAFVDSYYVTNPSFCEFVTDDPAKLTPAIIEKALKSPNLDSESELYFAKYMLQTYGTKKIRSIFKATNKADKKMSASSDIKKRSAKMFSVVKSKTSKNLVNNYYTWIKTKLVRSNGPNEDSYRWIAKNGEVIDVIANGYGSNEYFTLHATKSAGKVSFDFSKAMDFFAKRCHQTITGIYGLYVGTGEGELTVNIYDKNNKLLATQTEMHSIQINQDGAVRIEVISQGEHIGFMTNDRRTMFNKYATQKFDY